MLGVNPGQITKYKNDGRLVLDDSGRVMVEESRQLIADTTAGIPSVADRHAREREEKAAPRPVGRPSSNDPAVGASYQKARAVKEHFAAKSAQRDYEVSCGKLMESSAVIAAVSLSITTMRLRMESWPTTIAARLSDQQDETQRRAVLSDAVEELLQGLSEEFSHIAKEEK